MKLQQALIDYGLVSAWRYCAPTTGVELEHYLIDHGRLALNDLVSPETPAAGLRVNDQTRLKRKGDTVCLEVCGYMIYAQRAHWVGVRHCGWPTEFTARWLRVMGVGARRRGPELFIGQQALEQTRWLTARLDQDENLSDNYFEWLDPCPIVLP